MSKRTRTAPGGALPDAAPTAAAPRFDAVEVVLTAGLSFLLLMRPWWDGMTYPTSNAWFLWGILALAIVMGVRLLFRGRPIVGARPALLLAGLLLIALVTCASSIQLDASIRALLVWTGHLAVFVVAANGIRSQRAVGVVVASLLVAAAAEAYFSIFHLYHVLPSTRLAVLQDADIMRAYAGPEGAHPEFIHRLEVNRAFGSFMFPNALAGYLLLAVPLTLTLLLREIRALAGGCRGGWVGGNKARPPLIYVRVLLWMVLVSGACYAAFTVHAYLPTLGLSHAQLWLLWLAYVAAVPFAIAFSSSYLFLRPLSLALRWRFVAVSLLVPLAVLLLWALFLTRSRGGLVALSAATILGAALLLRPRRFFKSRSAVSLLLLGAVFAAACAAAPGATPPASPAPDGGAVSVEGVDYTLGDWLNPVTMLLRVSYWRVALRMVSDYPLTGVGFGNFGTAYAIYQRIEDDDTQQAHNDYLQMLAELGVFGLLFFLSFWLYLFVWGARRILREPEWARQYAFLALYLAVMAVAAHAVVDFDFSNPGIGSTAFVLAGLLCSNAAQRAPASGKPLRLSQAIGAALILISMFAGAWSLRIFRFDHAAGPETDMLPRLNAAHFFLARVRPEQDDPLQAPSVHFREAALLVTDTSKLQAFGAVGVPQNDDPAVLRPPAPNEPLPFSARLVITDPVAAHAAGRDAAQDWLAFFEAVDDGYPFSAEMANHIYQWYEVFIEAEPERERRKPLVMTAFDWAERAVERSPMQAAYHDALGRAYYRLGNVERGERQLQAFKEGLDQYRVAVTLFPTGAQMWQNYGLVLKQYARVLASIGRADEAAKYDAAGDQALQRAAAIPAEKRAVKEERLEAIRRARE